MRWTVICETCGLEKDLEMPSSYTQKEVQYNLDILNEEKLLSHRCSGVYKLKHGKDLNSSNSKTHIQTREFDVLDLRPKKEHKKGSRKVKKTT